MLCQVIGLRYVWYVKQERLKHSEVMGKDHKVSYEVTERCEKADNNLLPFILSLAYNHMCLVPATDDHDSLSETSYIPALSCAE